MDFHEAMAHPQRADADAAAGKRSAEAGLGAAVKSAQTAYASAVEDLFGYLRSAGVTPKSAHLYTQNREAFGLPVPSKRVWTPTCYLVQYRSWSGPPSAFAAAGILPDGSLWEHRHGSPPLRRRPFEDPSNTVDFLGFRFSQSYAGYSVRRGTDPGEQSSIGEALAAFASQIIDTHKRDLKPTRGRQ